jgi:hypothetical protein
MGIETQQYQVTFTGLRDMLLRADDISFASRVRQWGDAAENRKRIVPGDDRTPAWTWIGCLYNDSKFVVLPSDNLMTLIRDGAKRVPAGRRGATLKAQSQSGILIDSESWPILVDGQPIHWAPIRDFQNEEDFSKHEQLANALGFELFTKRAKIGTSKHVRVRPRFRNWSMTGTVTIMDETITQPRLEEIFQQAGRYVGCGDWRPASPKSPGPFGLFTATVERIG